jgi:hypothetical protein
VLHLPDVAQLVRDEVFVVGMRARAQEDQEVRRVAVEAPQPRQPEQPWRNHETHAREPDGPRVELEPVEPRLGADECA